MAKLRLMIADDHTIVSEGLNSILKDEFDVVAIANDGLALLEAARSLRPDVIVADVSMPLLNGLDALREIRSEGLPSKVVMLTMHKDAMLAQEAFRAGASGYLLKSSAGDELIAAINEVAAGKTYIAPSIAKDLIHSLLSGAGDQNGASQLTARQRQVLQLIAEGKTMKQIAGILKISARTAESHKYDMMHALGMESTAKLIQYAIRENIVSP